VPQLFRLGPKTNGQREDGITVAKLLDMFCVIVLWYFADQELFFQPANLEYVEIVDELMNSLGRSFVERNDAMASKLLKHGHSVFESHSMDERSIEALTDRRLLEASEAILDCLVELF
jgi:hypothetical protein